MSSNLGYEGSTNLVRSNNGIEHKGNVPSFPVSRLSNYPAEVIFSGRAIRKMDNEYKNNGNASTIEIKANFASGKNAQIFAINTNFFGKVQRDEIQPKSQNNIL